MVFIKIKIVMDTSEPPNKKPKNEASNRLKISKSTFGKKGQILNKQAREIISNVIQFMKLEAENIKTKAQPLVPFDHYRERVMAATGISIKTYKTVQSESKSIEAGELASFTTPTKKKRRVEIEHIQVKAEPFT